MVKIAVLASFNMDLVMRTERRPREGETLQGDFAMYLGGKGFNQAIAARRLGADVAVAGRVGDDEFGRRFLAALDAEGIDRTCVTVDREHGTGVASIIVDANGENAIIQAPRANNAFTYDDIVASGGTTSSVEIFQDRDCPTFEGRQIPNFLVGIDQLLTTFETPVEVSRACVADLIEIEHDVVMLNAAPATQIPSGGRPTWADVVVANRIEAEHISGMAIRTVNDAIAVARKFHLTITLGSEGAVSVGSGAYVHAPARAVRVVDTVGAGDAFCAALAVRLAEGATRAEAVRFANAAGALACTREGAEPSMPYRADVEALLAKGVPV